jgi:anti-anti-sigma regulatory factor/ligand-binding sensor protein
MEVRMIEATANSPAPRLVDLFDMEELTELLHALHRSNEDTIAVMDRENNMLVAIGFQDACVGFHRANPNTEAMCVESNQKINDKLFDGPFAMYKCPHGIVDVAFPILVDEHYVGTFWTGQIFLEPPDLDWYRQRAAQYGFDEAEYISAIERVPVRAEADIEHSLDFYRRFVGFVMQLGAERKRLLEIGKHQQDAIRQLASPIIEIWDGVLVVPLVARLDAERASILIAELLGRIASSQPEQVVIDLTGVSNMDDVTARSIVDISSSAQLLGANCQLTGLSPSVANTLAQMDVDLSSLAVSGTLKAGLRDIIGRKAAGR